MSEKAAYIVVSDEEGQVLFDRICRRELGIPGTEFLCRYDAGEYAAIPDDQDGRKIGRIVMLMPFARRVPA